MNQNYYKKVIVIGSAAITHKIAVFLKNCGVEVSVFEKYDANSQRKSSVGALCNSGGIAYHDGDKESLTEMFLSAAKEGPLLVVSAANRYIFPAKVIADKNITVVNYHNAKLPKHAGMHAEAWQIYETEKEAGVTWHFIAEEIDAGDIIAQETIPIDDSMTSIKLLKMQSVLAFDLFAGFSEKLLKKNIAGTAQEKSQNRVMHLAKDIPNGGWLDLNWDFEKISAFLRSMDYGIMKTLGDGKVLFDGQVYVWQGYEAYPPPSADGTPFCGRGQEKPRQIPSPLSQKGVAPQSRGIFSIGENLVIRKDSGEIILKKCEKCNS